MVTALSQPRVKRLAEEELRACLSSESGVLVIQHFLMYTPTGLHNMADSGAHGSHQMSACRTGIMTKPMTHPPTS